MKMDDLISRQAAIDSFWELDVEIRPSAINAIIDMIRNLPPAETPKRTGKSAQNVPNDDLISRKAAIEAVDATLDGIKELPSAQTEPHYCRECKWSWCHINVDKHGKSETYWRCLNWDGETDEEGYCHEWERRTDG